MAQDIIDQLSSLVSEFITRTTAKVRKDFREILITILILHISLPGRINFTQMGRFSNKSERTYRNRFECEYDWGKMNMELAKNMINRSKQKRLAVVVDASFLGKAGKKTPHVGLFWSGVNQAVKHGIELHSWAIVDADSRECVTIKAYQSPSPEEMKKKEQTRNEMFLEQLDDLDKEFKELQTDVLIGDAAYANSSFVIGCIKRGYKVVSRLKKNTRLFSLPEAPEKPKRGRPRVKGDKLDIANLPDKEFIKFDTGYEDMEAFEGLAYCQSLKRVIKLVVAVISKKERKLFFSTDVNMSGKDVVDFYRSRFQIEFTFRDAHMYTGLGHCEARSAAKLNFAINASLCTVNVMREYIAQENLDISIGQLKEIITRLCILNYFLIGRVWTIKR